MKIVVLAGGADQIALINEIKSRGHQVLLVDYFDFPPAKNYADKHIVASTLDIDKVKSIVEEERADLLTTACTDQALLTVAKVSEELSLPCYISYKKALNVTNKSFMKQVLIQNNIPTSQYLILDSCDLSNLDGLEFPLVVKPVDCNSSKGVKKVSNNEELISAVKEAIVFSRTSTAIVEEFKEGREISADFFIKDGKVIFLSATSSKKITNTASFTITQSYYPVLSEKEEKEVLAIAQQIAVAFQLDNTPLLIQLILNQTGFYVLEFSARMGGGSKYYLIDCLSGVNIMRKYVDLILGESFTIAPKKQVEFASMNYIYCVPGIFQRVENMEMLKAEGVIDSYFLYKTEGMMITKSETSGDRVAGFLVTASDSQILDQKMKIADNRLRVLDNHGMDIMKHGLY